jgi:hypothetical protein
VISFHVPLGGLRSKVEAAILKGGGTLAGIPTVCAIRCGRAYFLEIKTETGRVTRVQRECHEALERGGAIVGVVMASTSA